MKFKLEKISSRTNFEDQTFAYPSSLTAHLNGQTQHGDDRSHTFGVVVEGETELEAADGASYRVKKWMYFSVPGKFTLSGKGSVALFQRHGYRGLFLIGGPVESSGRLCYIDNASTTTICPPPRNGDPCLNLLTFSENIVQSPHIHPSLRLGVVLKGSGVCSLGGKHRIKLSVGDVFSIDPGCVHNFESGAKGLAVIAYHPDSDGGPTDQNHPMLNRTYLK